MSTYLILKERTHAFRSDPDVQEAMRAASLDELARPTLDEGESPASLLDRYDFETMPGEADRLAGRGYGFVHLQQLAVEHLTGAR